MKPNRVAPRRDPEIASDAGYSPVNFGLSPSRTLTTAVHGDGTAGLCEGQRTLRETEVRGGGRRIGNQEGGQTGRGQN